MTAIADVFIAALLVVLCFAPNPGGEPNPPQPTAGAPPLIPIDCGAHAALD